MGDYAIILSVIAIIGIGGGTFLAVYFFSGPIVLSVVKSFIEALTPVIFKLFKRASPEAEARFRQRAREGLKH